MIRTFLAGLCLPAFALFVLLFVSVPGWTKPICDNIDVMRPCAPIFQAERVSKREARRIARGQRIEQAMPFGAAIVPPETQRSFLAKGGDSKPRAWCGWWMRHYLGVKNPAGNLARWWAGYGAKASGPAVGTIVVWARGRRSGHVGIITGQAGNGQWVVKSGNDGNAVRERVRSVSGAIAFRWPA